MNEDYLSVEKDSYIKSTDPSLFKSYDYNGTVQCKFALLDETETTLKYSIVCLNLENKTNIQAINLFSEILFFKGKKKKDIILIGDYSNYNMLLSQLKYKYENGQFVKKIDQFTKERMKKHKNIDELYECPSLVPWNLVPREWDVINLVLQNVNKKSRILEIGSGYGKNLLLLKERGYSKIKGLEFSKNAWKQSLKFKKISHDNILGNVNNVPFEDSTFDVVLDIGCLHCVPKKIRVRSIAEIKRVLNKKGIIIGRFFLPKDKKWIKNYPIKISHFGITLNEVKSLLKDDFIIIKEIQTKEFIYVVGEVIK